MRRRSLALVVSGLLCLALAAAEAAADRVVTVTSIFDGGDGSRVEEQLVLEGRRTLTYSSTVVDPAGVFPYCTSLRIERRTKRGWIPAKEDWARKRDCFDRRNDVPSATATRSSWDMGMLLHGEPKHLLAKKRARIHGFTSRGGGITFPRRTPHLNAAPYRGPRLKGLATSPG